MLASIIARVSRTARAVATAAVIVVLAGATPGPWSIAVAVAGVVSRPPDYRAPVALRVLRGFAMPAGPYGPGHRGVDLAASTGTSVRTAAAGRVTFVGAVAGRGVVVVAHADGVRTEYEPVRAAVRVGVTVADGQVIGVVAGQHRGCAAGCLHWGARRGQSYLDPLSLLQPLGPVRLLPWPRAAS